MQLGYNTNGLANHDPDQALELLLATGFEAVAITIDHQWLNPRDERGRQQCRRWKSWLAGNQVMSVIETGARFFLNPRVKHDPPLVVATDQARPRVELIDYALTVAQELESRCVSIWSGTLPKQISVQSALDNLARNLEVILDRAEAVGVDIGFEPEPGMFIDTMAAFERLQQWIQHPRLKLTLDVGHLFCMGEVPIVPYIHRWHDWLVNVHIEDMRAGIHEHLMFGEGEINFPPIIDALLAVGYAGPLNVELSRHSHDAPRAMQKSFDFLKPLIDRGSPDALEF